MLKLKPEPTKTSQPPSVDEQVAEMMRSSDHLLADLNRSKENHRKKGQEAKLLGNTILMEYHRKAWVACNSQITDIEIKKIHAESIQKEAEMAKFHTASANLLLAAARTQQKTVAAVDPGKIDVIAASMQKNAAAIDYTEEKIEQTMSSVSLRNSSKHRKMQKQRMYETKDEEETGKDDTEANWLEEPVAVSAPVGLPETNNNNNKGVGAKESTKSKNDWRQMIANANK